MEASETTPAEAPSFDVSHVHELLDQAEAEFHQIFEGHDAHGHAPRLTPHLGTVRHMVDLSAQEAAKAQGEQG